MTTTIIVGVVCFIAGGISTTLVVGWLFSRAWDRSLSKWWGW